VRIIFARHAETGSRYQGRYIGSTDLPISEEGRRQAQSLAVRLLEYQPVHCLASPMLRTRQTAELLCGFLAIPGSTDDHLTEIDFGEWEGMSFPEICRSYPGAVDDWAANGAEFQFPGGDKTGDFWERMRGAATIVSGFRESPLLVVAHGGVIRSLLCHYLGLPMASYLLFNVQPARFAVVDLVTDRGVLSGLNL